jgi:hypothetical protein
MEKIAESIAAEISFLMHSLREVNVEIENYSEVVTNNVANKGMSDPGEVSESHKALVLKTNALLTTVRGPVDLLISNVQNVNIQ